MQIFIIFFTIIVLFFIQGCSQKNPTPTKAIQAHTNDTLDNAINIHHIDEKINHFINKKYNLEADKRLIFGVNYDTEYVKTASKTVIFIKYKNTLLLCGNKGCSGEMLEYVNDEVVSSETFMLIDSEIYLIHDFTPYGFSKVVIPNSYLNKKGEYSQYYNIYEPFSEKENENIYPGSEVYKVLTPLLNDRKKSIKLFPSSE
jgi:hypothetical protein